MPIQGQAGLSNLMTPVQCVTYVYQGEASYYDVRLSDGRISRNIAWWYPWTTLEATQITGLVAFYNEKVDNWVNGEKDIRPVTHFT